MREMSGETSGKIINCRTLVMNIKAKRALLDRTKTIEVDENRFQEIPNNWVTKYCSIRETRRRKTQSLMLFGLDEDNIHSRKERG